MLFLEKIELVISPLPTWLTASKSGDLGHVTLLGLPLYRDVFNSSTFTVTICNSTVTCCCLHLSVMSLPKDPPIFTCLVDHPILAAIVTGLENPERIMQSPIGRINLWSTMHAHLVGFNLQPASRNVTRHSFAVLDKKPKILSSLQILAQATNHQNCTSAINKEGFLRLYFLWKIGCGYLDDTSLHLLTKIETRFQSKPVISEWLGATTNGSQVVLLDWMVGEYSPKLKVRSKRHSPQVYQRVYPSRTAGAISEASGVVSSDVESLNLPPSSSTSPIVVQAIAPIEITVNQISNIRIPATTFDAPDGTKLQLKLFDHMYPMQFGFDFKDPSTVTGKEIDSKGTNWVSFDAANEILRLRPYSEHEGTHKFVLCAYNIAGTRACTNIHVHVKPPTPIKKSFILHVYPGIFWCYPVPVYWFSELKVVSMSDIDISVTGELFSWDRNKGEICVVTELQSEQIMAFFFRGTHKASTQAVEVEFRISVKVPPIEKIISSPRLRIRLRWMNAFNSYEMRELSRLNSSLAQVLRVRVNPSVTSQNIFIYDVLKIRNFQEKDNSQLSKLLEVEFVYLPLGLPDASYSEYWSLLDELNSRSWRTSTSEISHASKDKHFISLKGICESARLSGSVSALQAAAESLHPFHLESVTELELSGSACSRILQSSSIGARGDGATQSTDILCSIFFTFIQCFMHVRIANLPFLDQVIDNFTVEAGLAFKKRINPNKVVPMSRIRAIEIIDEYYNRLGDSAWINVAEDKTNLFGLPLQNQVRKDAYRFWLSILTVDHREPINIHFTVDVVKWPLKVTSLPTRHGWFPRLKTVHNHRVRMRMKLDEMAGRGISLTHNWPPKSPEKSLSYRWSLLSNLDRYFRPDCGLHCGVGIMLIDIQRQDTSIIFLLNCRKRKTERVLVHYSMVQEVLCSKLMQFSAYHSDQSVIQVDWALLPLLQEGLREMFTTMGNFSDTVAATSSSICPQSSIQDLQRRLLRAPLNHRYSSPSSAVASAHQDYFPLNDLRQASWSAPAPQLVEHLDWARLGTTMVIAVDLIGTCFAPYWKGGSHASVDGGRPSTFMPIVNFTTYIGELRAHMYFITDEETNICVIRSLMDVNHFVNGDQFLHYVICHQTYWFFLQERLFDTLYQRTIRACGLSRKMLDCLTKQLKCNFRLGDVLNVIWAKKSLVYLPSLSKWTKSSTAQPAASEKYLDGRKLNAPQRLTQREPFGELPAPRNSETDHESSCRWEELEKLTQRLQSQGPDPHVLPELVQLFARTGFGRLLDVKVERLGHCSGHPKSAVSGKLECATTKYNCYVSDPVNTMRALSITAMDSNLKVQNKNASRSGISEIFDKDWDWGYEYDDDGRKTTDLSTENPFYFMEFYNQDRSNDGNSADVECIGRSPLKCSFMKRNMNKSAVFRMSLRTLKNSVKAIREKLTVMNENYFATFPIGGRRPTSNQQPDTIDIPSPFDYLDIGQPTPFTTNRPTLNYPYDPSSFLQPQSERPGQQQPVSTQHQQRTFLLTTLLPLCAIVLVLLAIVLIIIWFLKCRGRKAEAKKSREEGDEAGLCGEGGHRSASPERVPLKEEKKVLGKKNGILANNGSQMCNKTPQKSLDHLKDIDSIPSAPSKPLIFPNEKPPLKPPEIISPMAKTQVDASVKPRVTSSGSPTTRQFYAMGQRPNPYRNLPPPIDTRFGLPRQMAPHFGPYRRDPLV
ncbi:unnamed protein product [Mesocestoides corti]|uniref:Dystroglycan n=1 Tax=Mesocestoides corti TaxID=53468 RepID=A0A158QU58_MESCO|nr:unnamed protein product [Mesocestoides corti]